jgi:hypothetical protein
LPQKKLFTLKDCKYHYYFLFLFNVRFISYSKCSNWRQISKFHQTLVVYLLWNFCTEYHGDVHDCPRRSYSRSRIVNITITIFFFSFFFNVRFISYLKCSNWRRISKLTSNFRCLFTFCYLDGASSIKTDLHFYQGRHSKFEPDKAQYSTPNFFDRLFLIREY